MSRTILVTGGLGYLGGRVCQALAADAGQTVIATTRSKSKPAPDWLAPAKLQPLDLFDEPQTLRAACRGVDSIVHLAQANDVDSAENPAGALRDNGLGTLALLRAAIDEKVRRFVYLSTAQVYCAPLVGRISEQTLPRPVHPYAITHRTAEDFVLAALDKKGIEGVVIRLANGTGCPASADVNAWRLIGNDLCRQVVQTGKIVLKSSGLQWRDFIPLSDVAAGIAHLIDLPAAELDNGLFNLGGAKPLRIVDYAEAVAARAEALFGKRPPLERVEPKPGESHPTLDYRIDKLLATGFEPKRDLPGEIDRTLELCKRAFA